MEALTQYLSFLNVLLIPGVVYIMRLEKRIMKLEILIAIVMKLDKNDLKNLGAL